MRHWGSARQTTVSLMARFLQPFQFCPSVDLSRADTGPHTSPPEPGRRPAAAL